VIFAIQQLWQRGYKNLAFLNGGVSAWAQAGFKFQQ
jgi:rhodanese-related sulfurtransferase